MNCTEVSEGPDEWDWREIFSLAVELRGVFRGGDQTPCFQEDEVLEIVQIYA